MKIDMALNPEAAKFTFFIGLIIIFFLTLIKDGFSGFILGVGIVVSAFIIISYLERKK